VTSAERPLAEGAGIFQKRNWFQAQFFKKERHFPFASRKKQQRGETRRYRWKEGGEGKGEKTMTNMSEKGTSDKGVYIRLEKRDADGEKKSLEKGLKTGSTGGKGKVKGRAKKKRRKA